MANTRWVEVELPADTLGALVPSVTAEFFGAVCELGARSKNIQELRFRRGRVAALIDVGGPGELVAEEFKRIATIFRQQIRERLDREAVS